MSPTRFNGPLPPPKDSGKITNFNLPTSVDEGVTLGGIGSGIIDLLSRGVYAGAGFSKELVKNLQGDKDAGNVLGGAWKGLTGENKLTYSDVINEIDPDSPEWVKFVGGLAGDILLDPANLLLGGATAAARAGIKATQVGKQTAKAAELAANEVAKPLTMAERKVMPTVNLKDRPDTILPILSQNRLAGIEANSKVAKMLMGPRRGFTAGFGFEEGFDALRSGANTAETLVTDYRKRYLRGTMAKNHTPSAIDDGWSAWKRGVPPTDPVVKAAHDDLQWGIEQFTSLNNPAIAALASHREGIITLNKALKEKGITHQFDLKNAYTVRGGLNGKSVIDPNKVMAQIKNWDVKNPLEFMDRANQAVTNATVKMSYADDVIKKWAKTTARPGYVKLNLSGDTALGSYLRVASNGKQQFFPKGIAEQLQRTDEFLRAPTNFKDSTSLIGKAVNGVVVPAMNIWKPYMTIARPGHHVRNIYSDMIISAMDGVMNLRVYTKALKVLKTGGALKRTGPPGLTELKEGVGKGTDKLSTVRLRGRNEDISADQTYKLGYNNGLMPSHNVSEDFMLPGATTGKTTTPIKDALLENRYMRGMGVVSEQSNHYTRMAHFIHKMEDKKFTRNFDNLDDVAAAAAAHVKKYHPDPTGLTPFERKNMRTLIPFYQWQRQSLPMVMNAVISKPGKVTGLNKIAYETSKALGLDPNSIGDPFPDNHVYPSFVRDNLIGPIADVGGMQLGFTTGSPQESILGDILNSQPQDVIGSNITPFISTPLDLISGVNSSTGTPIRSQPEYIDQQLPLISNLAKAAGYSPTSLITNLLQGNGFKMDQTLNKKRGEWHPSLDIANFLTGAGVSDFQKGSYKNIALKEKAAQ
jgi:hypothetical protein